MVDGVEGVADETMLLKQEVKLVTKPVNCGKRTR
jgi:hypothetical protein